MDHESAQRSTRNAQRTGYPSRESQRRFWSDEKESFREKSNTVVDRAKSPEDHKDSQKTYKSFRDLAVWQKVISLVKTIYQKTSAFPREELYGLATQMRRASVSIPSNIAEGYRRKHAKEFQKFLNVALGSMGELETQVTLAGELNYFSMETKNAITEELDHLVRMTVSLCNKVQR